MTAFRVTSLRQQFHDFLIPRVQLQHGSLSLWCLAAHNRAFMGCSTGEIHGGSGHFWKSFNFFAWAMFACLRRHKKQNAARSRYRRRAA